MRVAITGHRGLGAETTRIVDDAIRAELKQLAPPLVGISCLADGADQLFARAVLDAGGQLEVIVPAEQYRDGLPADAWAGYDALLGRASDVRRLDWVESTSEAHLDASRVMLETAQHLVAVWDGAPARGLGGTADIVDLARQQCLPVTVIWPDGATRD